MLVEHRDGLLAGGFEAMAEDLRAVARGEREDLLVLTRPAPLLAFGRRDELNSGFSLAEQAARHRGFQPWVRKVGGRAAAYHSGCVSVDLMVAQADPTSGNQERYRELGDLFVAVLQELGVQAGRGELPREYCPGEHSVHARLPSGARTKLVGTAQRVVSGAWWFSAAVVVQDREPLATVLTEVYAHLGLDLDPATVGSVQQILPEIRPEDLEDGLTEQLQAWWAERKD